MAPQSRRSPWCPDGPGLGGGDVGRVLVVVAQLARLQRALPAQAAAAAPAFRHGFGTPAALTAGQGAGRQDSGQGVVAGLIGEQTHGRRCGPQPAHTDVTAAHWAGVTDSSQRALMRA